MTQAPSPTSTQATAHSYLRVAELHRLKQMRFAPRRLVEGAYAGRHASPQRGRSVEFSDYRQYIPGDEIADVDWKVFGRSDRMVIKRYEHQTDMSVHLLIDASASMAYQGINRPSHFTDSAQRPAWLGNLPKVNRQRAARQRDPLIDNPSKYDHACLMAAAIAFLTIQQQDKVALGMARQGLGEFHRPAGAFNHLNRLLHSMEAAPPRGEANLSESLRQYAELTGRRGMLIVFSDLLEEPEPILKALARFTHRGGEVVVFHVLHADELHLPDLTDAVFHDSETGAKLRLNVQDVRPAYDKRIKQLIDSWRTALRARRMDYNLVSTAVPYHKALEGYLVNRATTR